MLPEGAAAALTFWIAEKDHAARQQQNSQPDLIFRSSAHVLSPPSGYSA